MDTTLKAAASLRSSHCRRRLEAIAAELYGDAQVTTFVSDVERQVLGFVANAERSTRPSPHIGADTILLRATPTAFQDPAGPLEALADFLRRYCGPMVSGALLRPVTPCSPGDPYAVTDALELHEDLGGADGLEALRDETSVGFDVVLGQTSARGRWFEGYRSGVAPFDRFFRDTTNPREGQDAWRPQSGDLHRVVETGAGPRMLWASFGGERLDLDYRHPAVAHALVGMVLHGVGQAATTLRLHEPAFTWRASRGASVAAREAHLITQLVRVVLDWVEPNVRLLADSNVPHASSVEFFGTKEEREADWVSLTALPGLLLHTLITGRAGRLRDWCRGLPMPSANQAYVSPTLGDGGIPLLALAGCLDGAELDRLAKRAWSCGGEVLRCAGRGGAFSLQVDPHRYLSRSEESTEKSVARLMVAQSISLVMPGIPVVDLLTLIGDLGSTSGADPTGEEAARANRSRSLYGVPLQGPISYTEVRDALEDAGSYRHQVYSHTLRFLKLRRRERTLDPTAAFEFPDFGDGVFAVGRWTEKRSLLALHNVTEEPVQVELHVPGDVVDRVSGRAVHRGRGAIELRGYEVVWLVGGSG